MLSKLSKKQTDEQVQIVQTDALRLPFPANTFDSAITVHVFHLVADVYQIVKELKRVLKPGALFLHCSHQITDGIDVLRDAWKEVSDQNRRDGWAIADAAFAKQSWQRSRDETIYSYQVVKTP